MYRPRVPVPSAYEHTTMPLTSRRQLRKRLPSVHARLNSSVTTSSPAYALAASRSRFDHASTRASAVACSLLWVPGAAAPVSEPGGSTRVAGGDVLGSANAGSSRVGV